MYHFNNSHNVQYHWFNVLFACCLILFVIIEYFYLFTIVFFKLIFVFVFVFYVQVADSVVWPWIREHMLMVLDPASSAQCSALLTLLSEAQAMCSEKTAKSITATVFSHVERIFTEQLSRVCLPLEVTV